MPPNQLSPVPGTVCVYVIRHGRTELNATNAFRGNANPALDSVGIKQAEVLADLFKTIDISHIFCSDKQRSVKTAEIIASSKKIPIHKSEGLRALNVGDFSGKKRTPESEAELQTYLDDPDTQIPGGESLNNFKDRIAPCLQEAVEIFSKCGVPPLLVAHSSVVHECGAILHDNHKAVLVEPGGAIAVYFNGTKLDAKPIFRPVKAAPSQAGSIT